MPSKVQTSSDVAATAISKGYQPIPITDGGKRPFGASWQHMRWDSAEQARASFDSWRESGASGVGLLLGEPSGNLVDIDLDHPKTLRLRDHFLPPSPMQTGRAGRPRSHRWYIVTDDLPGTRRYKMPDGSVSVELRATGGQTVIPPTIHPSGEAYRWEGTPWGGTRGPARVEGRKLAIQVALLAMGAVLLDNWPRSGGRHDAYLALAGGLLRLGDGVHPYWERNLPVVIEAMADATEDDDGPAARVAEVMGTTLDRLRSGGQAVGFPRLAEIIGVDHAEMVRRMAREVESLGWTAPPEHPAEVDGPLPSTLPPEQRNPMAERISSWQGVDIEPYLTGEVRLPEAEVLFREDGKGLMYAGRVNSLFGLSESAKTWVAMHAARQQIDLGERIVYLDFEDEPTGILSRFRALGAAPDDLKNQLMYVHPEDPHAAMQRGKYGSTATDEGKANRDVFASALDTFDPTLVVVDGLNELYGLHGHDTNDASGTTIITSWLKTLCRGGRTTVIVIDHTGKSGGAGASPIGAHHKVAMGQGTALRVDVIERPMPGAKGSLKLVVFKDRLGSVRQISTSHEEQVAGVVHMDSTTEGMTRMKVEVPDQDDAMLDKATSALARKFAEMERNESLYRAMVRVFGGDLDRRVKTAEVVQVTGAKDDDVREAWHVLQVRGVVRRMGENRHTAYMLRPDAPAEYAESVSDIGGTMGGDTTERSETL